MGTTFSSNKLRVDCKLALLRIRMVRQKVDNQLLREKRAIVELLRQKHDQYALVRTEKTMDEQGVAKVLDLLTVFIGLLLTRADILQHDVGATCTEDMEEACASICYCAQRLPMIPELRKIAEQLALKYGRKFAQIHAENQTGQVNAKIVFSLRHSVPDYNDVIDELRSIASEHNVDWQPQEFKIDKASANNVALVQNITKMYPNSATGSNAQPKLQVHQDDVDQSMKNDGLTSQSSAFVLPTSIHAACTPNGPNPSAPPLNNTVPPPAYTSVAHTALFINNFYPLVLKVEPHYIRRLRFPNTNDGSTQYPCSLQLSMLHHRSQQNDQAIAQLSNTPNHEYFFSDSLFVFEVEDGLDKFNIEVRSEELGLLGSTAMSAETLRRSEGTIDYEVFIEDATSVAGVVGITSSFEILKYPSTEPEQHQSSSDTNDSPINQNDENDFMSRLRGL